MTRVMASLVAALLVAALPSVPAQAADEPSLAVTGPPAAPPRTAGPRTPTYLEFAVSTAGLDQVHLSVTGDGVETDIPERDVDTTSGYAYVSVDAGADPGLHQVDVTFTAPGVSPVEFSFTLWAPGGAPLPATGDLSGRWWVKYDEIGESGRSYFADREIWFLDRTWAFVGVPRAGVPRRCTSDVTGCYRYRWDDQGTGYVEIGDRAIGLVTGEGIWLGLWDDGFGNPIPGLFTQRLGLLLPGTRLQGRWYWYYGGGVTQDHQLTDLNLTLRRDGTYTLARTTADGKVRTIRGTYVVASRGRIQLSGSGGRTFVPCVTQAGVPASHRCLVMEYRDHFWRGTVFQRGVYDWR